MGGTALVTGASAGIGAEFCRQLSRHCDRIIATGRRRSKLDALAAELGDRVDLHCIEADLLIAEDRDRLIATIKEESPLKYLVNNAGFGDMAAFADSSLKAQQHQVDLHITTTMALTHAALPAMIEAGAGNIINLSSVAAFFPYPTGMVYSGSKAFLNLFSEGLQAEVAGSGVKVQSLCPGYTYSEFHDRSGIADAGFTRDQVPSEMWMEASEVVAASLSALETDQVIVIPGEHNVALARNEINALLKRIG